MYKRTLQGKNIYGELNNRIQDPKEDKQKNFATRTHWCAMWILALVMQTRMQNIGQNLHGNESRMHRCILEFKADLILVDL